MMISLASGAEGHVMLATDSFLAAPALHGLDELKQALQARGYSVTSADSVDTGKADVYIIAGVEDNQGPASALLRVMNLDHPSGPEALVVQRTKIKDKPALILWGADDRGLMYAALDVADRVAWSKGLSDPFTHVHNTCERPYVLERALSIYTMQRHSFEQRLYDETYWRAYFSRLAQSRINSFVVIFGYENGGFMAPAYPYFFDVAAFPQVKLTGITTAQQQKNTAAFRQMIQIAHDHGVDVTVGLWDHIYRGGVQGGGIRGASERAGQRVEHLVYGVTADNLVPYNQAAIKKFLQVFPEIDGLQFRMHGESGLKRKEMAGFWHAIFALIKEQRPDLRVDIRAKQLPDTIIDDALDQDIKLRVATKYWMEQMGLPFHPTHVNRQNQDDRRHGYADLLRYPQTYKVHWRMWNGGTTRCLLWADPEYVRRFAASTRVYGGNSFEINDMLATKMLGEPHGTQPFVLLNPRFQFYAYEFERYWHYYQVWGRVSYNPDIGPEIWECEFRKRLGPDAGTHLMQGLHLASQVLPRIVAASYPYRNFPTTRGWAEMMRQGDLPDYAKAEGSDIEQFMNPAARAQQIIEGTESAMRRPEETSRWFSQVSHQILAHVGQAERSSTPQPKGEFICTVTDLKILAHLAQYHAARLQAAVEYNLYKLTGDLFSFDRALAQETRAVAAWEQIVEAAGELYHSDMAFGVQRVGFSRHWKEELQKLKQGLEKLQAQRKETHLESTDIRPKIVHVPVRQSQPEKAFLIQASIVSPTPITEAHVWVQTQAGAMASVAMKDLGEGRYQARIAPQAGQTELAYYIEAVNAAGHNRLHPFQNQQAAPIHTRITDDRQPPELKLERSKLALPFQDLRITAQATDASAVKWMLLRYRHLTQFEDYKTAGMRPDPQTGLWSGTIPGDFITPEWDLMYYVQVMDNQGNGRMYPDLETEMPYVIVPVER
jgi:hypothetical protein